MLSNADSMRWSELLYGQQQQQSQQQQSQQQPQQAGGGPVDVPNNNNNNNNNGAPLGGFSAPTIKNHSVTHFGGYLYCFGGYDGRRNHMTLLIYSIAEQRWIQPIMVNNHNTGSSNNGAGPGNGNDAAAAMPHHGGGGAAAAMDGNHASSSNNNNNSGNNHNSIFVTGTPPPGRNGHSATLAVDDDDESSGRIIIIGGWLGTGPLAASDMHVLDVSHNSNGRPQLQWYQPTVKGTPPGPCNMHSADYVHSNKSVYVFRGGNGREYLNDLHALCCTTLTWRRVETTGEIPQQRANHSSAIMEESGELFIFGGWNGIERLNDIHILDTFTSTWTRPHVSGVLPHPRAGMTLTALRGRLFLFGGSGTSAKCFQDLQILDRREMAWLDVTPYSESAMSSSNNHNNNNQQHRHPIYGAAADEHYDYVSGRFQFGGNRNNVYCPYDDVAQLGGSGSNISHNINNNDGDAVTALGYQGAAEQDHDASQQQQQQNFNNINNNNPYYLRSQQQQQGGDQAMMLGGGGIINRPSNEWRSRPLLSANINNDNNNNQAAASATAAAASAPQQQHHHHQHRYYPQQQSSPNPNDEDTVPVVLIHGRGPGRRAGHTATAVHRKIYVFGGSCGSDYLNDFFVLDTDPPPVARINAQLGSMQLMERRLGHFFNDEEFSDVTFVVQGQKVHGHKMILSIVSDCFRAMFTAGFLESQAMEIEIPDCSHAAFLAVMKYIYTGSLPSTFPGQIAVAVAGADPYHQQQQQQQRHGGFGSSSSLSSLSSLSSSSTQQLSRVVELLELADRFFLDHLKQICETMLQPAVNSETVEYLAGVAQKTNAAQLQAVCDHFVRNRQSLT